MPRNYDIAHLQKLLLIEHRVKRAYERAIDDFARIYDWMEQPKDEDETLEFDKQPLLKPQVQKIMNRLQKGVNVAVVDGVKTGWNLAQEKNNDLTRKVFGRAKGKKLTEEQIRAYFTRNEDGLRAFLSRKHQGLSLSEYVWKFTAPFKEEMEMAIELAMREGRSADEMSRDVREYLKHPDMLFRRVKNRNGRLKLSKRAAAYHPGRGVYRSSYKNARRLAATEGNIAYRTADHERWQEMDFVVGFEVKLSNNHTCLNSQGKAVRFHDMCDDLQGKYPKQFKFTGWHPHCRCFAVPILKTEDEMARDTERILDGEEPLPNSKNAVQEMPEAFTTWIDNNAARIAAAHEKVALGERASIPFFLKDNFKDGKPENGYIWHEEKKELSIDYRDKQKNKEDYEKYRRNPAYKDVAYDENSGGFKATHVEHNLDKNKGWYEISVQNTGFLNGHSVILEKEDHTRFKTKNVEGLWDGFPFEIAGAENATSSNNLKALKHCAKKGAEVAVLFYPNNNFNIKEFELGLARFNGLRGQKGQHVDFKLIYCIQNNRIVLIKSQANTSLAK